MIIYLVLKKDKKDKKKLEVVLKLFFMDIIFLGVLQLEEREMKVCLYICIRENIVYLEREISDFFQLVEKEMFCLRCIFTQREREERVCLVFVLKDQNQQFIKINFNVNIVWQQMEVEFLKVVEVVVQFSISRMVNGNNFNGLKLDIVFKLEFVGAVVGVEGWEKEIFEVCIGCYLVFF